ncbi:MAG TPA: MMPL family transporter [Solirubrobacteraceae bacterium]|nr:MMPL family transporter [Solirubrobacteraceae bacterium]
MPTKNLAARAGRWSAQHRKTAIFGWFAFVIAAFMIGGNLGTKTLEEKDLGVGDSGRATQIVDKAFPEAAGEQVFVQSTTQKATDPAYRAAVRDIEKRLAANPEVTEVKSPYDRANPGQISPDGHSALVNFEMRGTVEQAQENIDSVLATTAAAQKAHPELRIEQFGGASAGKAVDDMFADDLHKAETLSLPITLIILLFAFGALVAAGLPLLLGLTAVAGTMGIVAGVSQFAPATDNLMSIVLLIGLAVGVDYSLFYIRREREERKAGRDAEAALQAAAATSGRTVLVSGFTVMAAMAGMYLTGDKSFSSMATGTILVVAVAMIGSLTVLPAMLSKLGDRIDRGRIPFIGKRMAERTESRAWSWLLDRVLRRPLAAAVVSAGLLVALSIPAFGLHTANAGTAAIPADSPVMQTYNRISEAFPGSENVAQVVVKADDVTKPEVGRAIVELQRKATATGTAIDDITTDVSADRTVATLNVPMAGNGNDAKSVAGLQRLREDIVPATVGQVHGVEAVVGGDTAANEDYNDMLKANAPIVFAFVLSLAFLLLLATFRSIVVPIKAIVLNLLSVGAAYGVLVLVFQKGWGESLLGFESTGAIEPWLPLFLFVILFGLSMDYHVFILSRVREAVDRGMSTDQAVAHGIKSTASVVSSAAIVMVAVFAIFAVLSSIVFKEIGVGLAVAILIDATIVRGVLLPATMKLLGDRNWYLPRKLGWLPKVHHEPEVAPAAA